MNEMPAEFWAVPATEALRQLGATPQGLASAGAADRLARFGPNVLQARKRTGELTLLIGQFKSPLILILLFAAGLSFFLHDAADALIILGIVLASGVLGFWQERGAAHAVEALLDVVQTKATAMRDGAEKEIPVAEIVPGDIVVLSAGKNIPGDCLIL
jgi:Mg2+-importing ATPase